MLSPEPLTQGGRSLEQIRVIDSTCELRTVLLRVVSVLVPFDGSQCTNLHGHLVEESDGDRLTYLGRVYLDGCVQPLAEEVWRELHGIVRHGELAGLYDQAETLLLALYWTTHERRAPEGDTLGSVLFTLHDESERLLHAVGALIEELDTKLPPPRGKAVCA